MEYLILLVVVLFFLGYTKPYVDFDNENNQIIVHYSWKGIRKTYIIK